MPVLRGPIWRNRDFVRIWAAATVSTFGALIARTALPFTAILVLGAGPIEIAIIRSLEFIAGLSVGLFAGAWVDRLRRRPILIAADLGRAALLISVPAAAMLHVLSLPQTCPVGLQRLGASCHRSSQVRTFPSASRRPFGQPIPSWSSEMSSSAGSR